MSDPWMIRQARRAVRELRRRVPKASAADIRAGDALRWLDRSSPSYAPAFAIRVAFHHPAKAWAATIVFGVDGAPHLPLVSWDIGTGEILSHL